MTELRDAAATERRPSHGLTHGEGISARCAGDGRGAAPLVALPIRSFDGAYRRLEAALDPDRRGRLARALAARTAATVRRTGSRPLIVSSAPEVREFARVENYDLLADPPGGGLDAAAGAAVRHAGDRPWLILHADLPWLAPEEVVTALEMLRSGRRVLAPSYDGGTSALGGFGPYRFSYGVGSYHRHLTTGPAPAVISSPGFQLDIDSPHDLEVARRGARGAWLRSLSLNTEAGRG